MKNAIVTVALVFSGAPFLLADHGWTDGASHIFSILQAKTQHQKCNPSDKGCAKDFCDMQVRLANRPLPFGAPAGTMIIRLHFHDQVHHNAPRTDEILFGTIEPKHHEDTRTVVMRLTCDEIKFEKVTAACIESNDCHAFYHAVKIEAHDGPFLEAKKIKVARIRKTQ